MSTTPSAAPANGPQPSRPRPPTNIWTHLADIFDRCLEDDQRAQRLHGFTDPLVRVVLAIAATVAGVLLLVALAAAVLLVIVLTVSTAPTWMPAAGAAGLTGSIAIGFLLRSALRAAGRRIANRGARP